MLSVDTDMVKGVMEQEFCIYTQNFLFGHPLLPYLVIISHMHSHMILNKLAISQKIIISMAILQISSTMVFQSYGTCLATVA